MSTARKDPQPHGGSSRAPEPGETTIPELEADETVAPRPEEEIADIARAVPDTSDHGAD